MQFKYTVTPSTVIMRGCRQCGRNLPESAFNKAKFSCCRECYNARQSEIGRNRGRTRPWSQKRNNNLLHKYGITLDDFYDMLDSQGNRCAICQTEKPTVKGWHVDHCHTTGAVRGILCGPCNLGLGMFGDDPERLTAAIRYLENSSEK